MQIDLPTLLAADAFVTATVGLLLLVAGWQSRGLNAAVWWSCACISVAAATSFLAFRRGLPDLPSRMIVATLINLAGGLYWAAARRSHHQKVPAAGVVVGAAVWLSALAIPDFRASPQMQIALFSLCGSLYSVAAAAEFWRGRGEGLRATWPLCGLFVLDASLNAMGVFNAWRGELSAATLPPLTTGIGLLYFEAFVLAVGGAFFIVALERERRELELTTAADTDALTGVASRRAFMGRTAESLAQSRKRGEPWSLIAFDLDGFKSINDTHGHAAGDLILRRFGEVSRGFLRSNDLMGRLGGEEFAAALPATSPSAAYVIADRIRIAFAAACLSADGRPVKATVSAGIASALPQSTVESILRAADDELYRAKRAGRNRVARADGSGSTDDRSSVIRVA